MRRKLLSLLLFITVFTLCILFFMIFMKTFIYNHYVHDISLEAYFLIEISICFVILFLLFYLFREKKFSLSAGLLMIVAASLFSVFSWIAKDDYWRHFIADYFLTLKGFLVTETPIIASFLAANGIHRIFKKKFG